MECFEGCHHCELERTKKSRARDLQRKRNQRYYETHKEALKEKRLKEKKIQEKGLGITKGDFLITFG